MKTTAGFWRDVEDKLRGVINKTHGAYYVGGTLMLPVNGGEVGLNLNGKYFTISSDPEVKGMQPTSVTEMVRRVYLVYKGYTSHYSRTITGDCGNII